MFSVRTVRSVREHDKLAVKKSLRSVNCISLRSLGIFHCPDETHGVNWLYGPYTVRSIRTLHTWSVKKSLRSINCISLRGLSIFHCPDQTRGVNGYSSFGP